MKHFILMLGVCLCLTSTATAQPHKRHHDGRDYHDHHDHHAHHERGGHRRLNAEDVGKFSEIRIKHLTENIQLDAKDTAEFASIIREYDKKIFEKKEQAEQSLYGLSLASDAELNSKIDEHIQLKEEMLRLEKERLNKLRTLLSPRQFVVVLESRVKIRRKMLKEGMKRKFRGGR